MNNILISITVGVIVFTITLFILKSVFRAVLIGILALFIFRVGWVYTADDLFEKFKLNEVIKEEYQEDVYEKYDKFSNKRDEKSIIDTKEIDENIREKEDEIKQNLERKLQEKKQAGK